MERKPSEDEFDASFEDLVVAHAALASGAASGERTCDGLVAYLEVANPGLAEDLVGSAAAMAIVRRRFSERAAARGE